MVTNKYKYFTVRKAALFLLLLGVVSCNTVSDALIVGEESFNVPLSSNIDSISAESIFYFGLISKDGIDRFEKDVFQELLFDINAKKNTLHSDKEIYQLRKSLERRPFKLVYVLDAILVDTVEAAILKNNARIENNKKIAEIVFNPTIIQDSTNSMSIESQARTDNEILALTALIGLKEKAIAQKQMETIDKRLIVVPCVRSNKGDVEIHERYLERLSGMDIEYFSASGWNRFYVLNEFDLVKVREVFPDAWRCEYGK